MRSSSRLVRPRHPLFWLLVALQVLSGVFALVLTQAEPAVAVAVLLSALLVANASVSALIVWRLWREPD
ncbi:hypothetical protein [Pseudazoarcus pumilus]|uniref:Uncharacterized protein n=1 Tax=Pseudazoarcus pumilus TaxID=2067960 RepID=A0A2I6S5G3_9RHOO|nr:hypothetical protein [Pseudazoarcus pumilus]AUN94497.1 hypothetical protein C0099_05805 [Pseudazoarcus pumilus]